MSDAAPANKDLISTITSNTPVIPAKPAENAETVATPAADTTKPAETVPAGEAKPIAGLDLLSDSVDAEELPPVNRIPNGDTATAAASPGEDTKRKRGRPPGTKNKPAFDDVAAATATPVDYKSMSEGCFDLSATVLSSTFGPEWQPRTPEERQAVCGALEVYLRSKQAKDIPPGLMLTIVVVAYATPRLTVPTTKAKLYTAWTWLKEKFRRKPVLKIV